MIFKPSYISTKLKQAHITQQEDHFHLHYSLYTLASEDRVISFHYRTARHILQMDQQNVKRNSTAVCMDDIQLAEC